jgi:hypothetical protein
MVLFIVIPSDLDGGRFLAVPAGSIIRSPTR